MRSIWFATLLVGVWWMSRLPEMVEHSSRGPDAEALAALGLIILGGHLVGRLCQRIKLPQVTGYMITGVIAGPHLAGVFSGELVSRLSVINEVTLVLIAFAAGGELKLPELKNRWREIAGVLTIQTVFIVAASLALVLTVGSSILPLKGYSVFQLTAVGLVLGTLTSANSPSVAIAVISEMKARGRLTNLIMGVTVPKDVVVIVLFALAMTMSRRLFIAEVTGSTGGHTSVVGMLIISVIVGIVWGMILVWYLKHVGHHVELAVLIAAIVLMQFSHLFAMDLLLTAVIVGLIVENYSAQGEALMSGLARVSPPVMVAFFALAGAAMNPPGAGSMLLVALLWALCRALCLLMGTSIGLRIAGSSGAESPVLKSHAWYGFIPQAGVAIGLTAMYREAFPEVGTALAAMVMTAVAVNQVLGPIGFRAALIKAGDAGRTYPPAVE